MRRLPLYCSFVMMLAGCDIGPTTSEFDSGCPTPPLRFKNTWAEQYSYLGIFRGTKSAWVRQAGALPPDHKLENYPSDGRIAVCVLLNRGLSGGTAYMLLDDPNYYTRIARFSAYDRLPVETADGLASAANLSARQNY